ncbi:MAG: hypothetical protein KatS3mg103_1329 [Phycisphaerales bacterium]|nr:MAG: hypothetical protein KatS3mg103_1329 [Phycisphaerales bacterium]
MTDRQPHPVSSASGTQPGSLPSGPVPPGPVLAHNLLVCQALFERFLAGFDEASRTRQGPGLPNHLAWTLGHLALTAHRCTDRVLGADGPGTLPAEDFLPGSVGDADRYGAEGVAFGSTPVDDPSRYPTLARGLAIMHAAHERLAEALRRADAPALARTTPWGAGQTTVADLALRMGFHVATHAGQIIDLRRALGLGPVLGGR